MKGPSAGGQCRARSIWVQNSLAGSQVHVEPSWGSGRRQWFRLASLLVAVVVVGRVGLEVLPDWQEVTGWEAYWIAQSLAAGEGFSFPSNVRWLFDSVNDGGYHPTAWMDPVYTFCLAGLILLFGEYHQMAAAIFNLVLLLVAFGLTYRLGERLISPAAGLVAVMVLALIELYPATALHMNNPVLASVMVLLSASVLLTYLEAPTNRRAGVLGLVLGLTALACPSSLYFMPVTVAMVAALGWRNRRPALIQASLVFLFAVLAMLPWTIRNYLTFQRFVPVRNGTGQMAFLSVVGPAGTVAPETVRSQVKPSYGAESPYYAISHLRRYDERHALYSFQMDYAKELGGTAFAAMNEAERDAWFLKETKEFMRAHPALSLRLAIEKLKLFLRVTDHGFGIILCLLAAAGGLLAIRTPAALTLSLWVAAFVGPFLIIAPFFYRYRAPIEPLLALLAVFAAWKVLGFGFRRLRVYWPAF